MKKGIQDFLVRDNVTVREAMKQIGRAGQRILFVISGDERLIGSLTDGDIRRWVLAGGSLRSDIKKLYNRRPISVRQGYDGEALKKVMIEQRLPGVPVVNEDGLVKEILVWSAVFGYDMRIKKRLHYQVVIMAGGKGSRLDPFTRVLPKPLIPIGDKTILEMIMGQYAQYGIHKFYLSINHKSRMIKAYFEENSLNYDIHFVEEKIPLGTAGSLRLLNKSLRNSFFVSNCDIIIDGDYEEMMDFHNSAKNDLTIIGSFRHFVIPYGICKIENGGTLVDLQEKPEYDYLVNTGMYILKSQILKLIPRSKPFNMTDLIHAVREQGGRVGVFPIDEKSWIDVGQWEEYGKSVKALEIRAKKI